MGFEKVKSGITALGDAWYLFRVFMAELFLLIAIMVMPKGSERDELLRNLFNYIVWTKDE